MIKATDLTQKEVISLSDGRRLGLISDLEVDLKRGRINAIIVPSEEKGFNFLNKEADQEIRWGQIRKIGFDVILVELINNTDVNKEDSALLIKSEKHIIDIEDDGKE
ncbi:YlmC/YmxH family sporulation protein [Serpentinicella sp. ANB-PHB4]|uniref:YlmC/YmxH family sporulation protein n=1 Tax=Serpentinicella sp. ANB-PHB4 TaxID=3074076 RepID=UPI0028657CB7|nr:YlmC/YmxH family sporulation protein [Serpentinicella sp. ANB-PHB4]MDR5657905.1 YlmC/YmxH family sporulation protein [Serpentinicella sp. ANB-PHB4]